MIRCGGDYYYYYYLAGVVEMGGCLGYGVVGMGEYL